MEDLVKIKDVMFFYNNELLEKIINQEVNLVNLPFDSLVGIPIGAYVKFRGKYAVCIVKIVEIWEKDCNRNCRVLVKLVQSMPGDLPRPIKLNKEESTEPIEERPAF